MPGANSTTPSLISHQYSLHPARTLPRSAILRIRPTTDTGSGALPKAPHHYHTTTIPPSTHSVTRHQVHQVYFPPPQTTYTIPSSSTIPATRSTPYRSCLGKGKGIIPPPPEPHTNTRTSRTTSFYSSGRTAYHSISSCCSSGRHGCSSKNHFSSHNHDLAEEANVIIDEPSQKAPEHLPEGGTRSSENSQREEQANVVRFGGCAILDSGASTGVYSLEAADDSQRQRL